MAPRTAIITYSLYHHIAALAELAKAGIESAGGSAKLFQVEETLPESLLKKLNAPPRPNFETATVDTLKEYDAFLFGIPTRYGNFPSQFKNFWDQTGALWANGELIGKPAGVFVSTGTLGGGQETTVISTLSTLVHHGMVYVPLGYRSPLMASMDEIHGGSPWGAGTFAGSDGSRKVTDLELEVAKIQGLSFFETIKKMKG
ncbi:flavodoxin-like fold protein [Naganishia cerealis]|uniref:Flavodoxin-like fold protein n=1 Tax=Naganishia cerealis TaxID=610337 RepID=A0ACC2W571_9TREE|nr:flavodoxin-like fold protein [Naganishia cerealis]